MLKTLWECPKCHEHFYQYVIDSFTPACPKRAKDCPARASAGPSQDEIDRMTIDEIADAVEASPLTRPHLARGGE